MKPMRNIPVRNPVSLLPILAVAFLTGATLVLLCAWPYWRATQVESYPRYTGGTLAALALAAIAGVAWLAFHRGRSSAIARIADESKVTAERLGFATQVAAIGVYDWDARTREASWSDRMFEIYGLPKAASVAYETWKERVVPEDLPAVEASLERVLTLKQPETVEFRIRRPDGELRHIRTTAGAIVDDRGDATRVVGVNLDVTDLRRTEGQLALLNFALDQVEEAAYLVDEHGRFAYVNEAACRTLGHARADLLRLSVPEIDPDHPPERWRQHWLSLQREGSISLEVRHRTRDGRMVPVEISANYFEYGGQAWNFALGRDITARKAAEEALRRSEQSYRTLAESTPDIIIRYDRECRRTFVNAAYERQVGIPRAAAIGDIPQEHWRADVPVEEYRARLQQTIATGEASDMVIRWPNPEGINVTFMLHFEPERNAGGEVTGVLTVGRNVHDLLETERQLRTLVENLPDLVTRFDAHGRLLFANPSVTRLFGEAGPAQRRNKTLIEPIPDGQAERNARIHAEIMHVITERQPRTTEGTWPTPHGDRTLELRLIPEIDDTDTLVSVLGIGRDITERRRAEQDRQAHLHFFESMDRVNRAMQSAHDPPEMMHNVLETLLDVLACDRAWLVYPCDPDAPTWRVAMERTRPEYPGGLAAGCEFPMDPEVARVQRLLLATDSPLTFGAGSIDPVPRDVAEHYRVQSFIAMAVRPSVDRPYMFGLHQCSSPRAWSPEDQKLFQEIGRRLADALSTQLTYTRLQESERRLNTAQHIAQVGYWDYALAADRITWSDETYRIFGLAPQERVLSFATLTELIHPDDRPRVREATTRATQGGPRYDLEYRIVRPNGDERIVHSQGDVLFDDAGYPFRAFGVVQDITERRRAEEALRRQIRMNDALFNQSISPFVLLTPDGRFIRVNEAWASHYNRRVEDFPGRTLAEVIPAHVADDSPGHPLLREVLATRKPLQLTGQPYVFAEQPERGTTYWDLLLQPILDEAGEIEFVFFSSLDVTERERAQDEVHRLNTELEQRVAQRTTDLEAANHELEAFSYSVSHDLRAPLRSIDGFSRILLEDYASHLDEEGRDSLRRVRAASQRMGKLIDDLLQLSRTARIEVRRVPVNLSALAQAILGDLQQSEPGRVVECIVAPRLTARGDPTLLRTLLENLLGNAWKFTARRAAARIEFGAVAPGGNAAFFVRDNGAGFSMQYAGKLFSPFQRLHKSADFPGSGVGLATAQRIVQRHGGTIRAEAEVEHGATFTFTLPETPPAP